MVRREIRKKAVDLKGREHNKLICVFLVAKDTVHIFIKDRNFEEPILVDVLEILYPYLTKETIEAIKKDIAS